MYKKIFTIILMLAYPAFLGAMESALKKALQDTFLAQLPAELIAEIEKFGLFPRAQEVANTLLKQEAERLKNINVAPTSFAGESIFEKFLHGHLKPILDKEFKERPHVASIFTDMVINELRQRSYFKNLLDTLKDRMLLTMALLGGTTDSARKWLTELIKSNPESKAVAGQLVAELNLPVTSPHLRVSDKEKVDLLLQAGADVNTQNEQGSTALMTASWNADLHLVQFLLAQGADPRIVNKEGRTALSYARERADLSFSEEHKKDAQEVVRLLEEALKHSSK